jgi:hypothetical protein
MTDPTQPSPAVLAAMLSGAPEGMPAPPSRAALAAVLAQAAEGAPLLADRPVYLNWLAGKQRIDLANGWKLWVWWGHGGHLDYLESALSPDGAHWSHGCDRWPDWNAGPDAVVLDPLTHLITPEQRERLRQRLLTCSCWPEPDPLPVPSPPTREQMDALWPVEEMAS